MNRNLNAADSTELAFKIFIPSFCRRSNHAINSASNPFIRPVSQISKVFSRLIIYRLGASANVGLKVSRIVAVRINEVSLPANEPVATIRAICARVNFYDARFDSFEDLFDLEADDPNVIGPPVPVRIGLGLSLRAVNDSPNKNRRGPGEFFTRRRPAITLAGAGGRRCDAYEKDWQKQRQKECLQSRGIIGNHRGPPYGGLCFSVGFDDGFGNSERF